MKEHVTYTPFYDDDEKYLSKEECIAAEDKFKKNMAGCHFYSGIDALPFEDIEEADYLYNNADRLEFDSKESLDWFDAWFGMCARTKDGRNSDLNCLKYVGAGLNWVEAE